jgi:hypothetical protein
LIALSERNKHIFAFLFFNTLKKITKKITALTFCLLGAFPLFFILFSGFKQQQIRHRMKERLELEMLHTITIAESDVQWLNEGKEMLINGRMFDVKSFQRSNNNKIIVTGLFDDDETALVKAVKTTQENDHNNTGKLLVKLFQLTTTTHNNLFADILIPTLLINNYFPDSEQRLASEYLTILTPPPRV